MFLLLMCLFFVLVLCFVFVDVDRLCFCVYFFSFRSQNSGAKNKEVLKNLTFEGCKKKAGSLMLRPFKLY